MTQQTATWTVSGANWVWKTKAPLDKSPVEIATLALESFWNQSPDPEEAFRQEAWKREEGLSPSFKLTRGTSPSLGIDLFVEHDKMENPQDQRIQVSAITALANAGFHHDAERLNKAWEDEQTNNA